MPVGRREDLVTDAELGGAAANDRARGFDGFLHHVAERPRTLHGAITRELQSFDREDVAAHFRPGEAVDDAHARRLLRVRDREAAHAEEVVKILRVHRLALRSVLPFPAGFGLEDDLAQDLADRAFEPAHARLTRVVADDVANGVLGDAHFLLRDAVGFHLLGDQMAFGDVHLFVFGVARKRNHLHAVEKRRRDVVGIRRRDEHHLRKIVGKLHVVVFEGVVLFRIEHFEKRRRRIAPEVRLHLVDFVEEEERIAHLRLDEALDDAAGHRAHVGAAVTADFRFVAHAAQGHADVFASRGAGDAAAERGLADARGADEAEDRSLRHVDAALHGEVLENAFLHLFEAPVVGVEHFARLLEVGRNFGALRPGYLKERVEVGANDGRLGARGRHLIELLGFVLDAFAHDFGEVLPFFVELLEVFIAFALFLFVAVEFAAQDLDLLVNKVVALVAFDLLLDARLDAAFEVAQFVVDAKRLVEELVALRERFARKKLHLALERNRRLREHRVEERLAVRHAYGHARFMQRSRVAGAVLGRRVRIGRLHLRDEFVEDGAEKIVLFRFEHLGRAGEARRLELHVADAGALETFDEHLARAVREFDHLRDDADHAEVVEILGLGRLDVGVALRHEGHERLRALVRAVDDLKRRLARHEHGRVRLRIRDDVAQRDERQRHRLGFMKGRKLLRN